MSNIIPFPGKKAAKPIRSETVGVVIYYDDDGVPVGVELETTYRLAVSDTRRIATALRSAHLSIQRDAAEQDEHDDDVIVAAYVHRDGSATVHAYEMHGPEEVQWARDMLEVAKDAVEMDPDSAG